MTKRSDAGREAKLRGDLHEQWVEGQHGVAQQFGILGPVEHNEPHFCAIGGGRFEAVAPGVADYTGALVGGRYLAVEAKSTADERFYKNAITPKQQRHLDEAARSGGLALLVVEFRRACLCERTAPSVNYGCPEHGKARSRNCFAIPWLEVPWERARSADSIRAVSVEIWEVVQPCYLSRWHSGGPRVVIGGRKYPVE